MSPRTANQGSGANSGGRALSARTKASGRRYRSLLSFEMKHDLPEREFTEVNEGNEELAWSSLPSLPSVARQGFHPLVPAGGTERRNFEPVTAANAGGPHCLPIRALRAAGIAEFCRWVNAIP